MITPAEIDIDITKLRNSIRMCIKSIRNYQKAIENERVEQRELSALVNNPGEYDVEALKVNVEKCDKHIEEFEKTIKAERQHISTYEQIISVLEDKKCQLDTTSLSTGV